ncbi:hypothetical protein VTH06DRAFT_214 [Thermothelomyces fergusii]
MRSVEQEKLRPVDASARVTVPVLDFSIPVPEWEERMWESKDMFRWIQKNLGIDWYNNFKWPQNRAMEQRLAWVPLPHMGSKKLVSEKLEEHAGSLEFFLEGDSDEKVFTSANYVYKEPGLAILRSDTNDDGDYLAPLLASAQPLFNDFDTSPELGMTSTNELASTPRSNAPSTARGLSSSLADLTNLLSRRKRQIEEVLLQRQPDAARRWPLAADAEISASDVIDPSLIASTNVLRGFVNEYTDFGPLVENFLEMHFPKKQKLSHSAYFAKNASMKAASQFRADEAARLMPPPPKPVPALAPVINRPETPPRVVISSTVSHTLIQQLECLVPGIEIIPRDYGIHRINCYHPGTELPDLDEADIVVSPATGILVTTMVQLRQRAIPGGQLKSAKPPTTSAAAETKATATATANFSRILENVAVRHERVVVLVSEGNKHNETASPLSQSDARALAELQGLGAGLSVATAHVHVVYVGGGVETLAKWIAAVVCESYVREAAAVRELLLPVETSWEVFLRRVGMNVFAAQVVLGKLKVPDGDAAIGGQSGQVFGLPLFVLMSREQRVEMFADTFGGRRVLDRVSDVIDRPWEKHEADRPVVNSVMTSKTGSELV